MSEPEISEPGACKYTINLMYSIKYMIGIAAILLQTSCDKSKVSQSVIYDNIPSLEDLSGRWVSADTADMEPSIRNFRGQALCNRDLTSVSWFAAAPYSGGYHTGVMRINGKVPMASTFRWFPYHALRKGTVDQWEVSSTTGMLADRNAIAWNVEIINGSDSEKELNLELDMIGYISKYGGDWQWWYPYPKLTGTTTIRDEEVENMRKHIGSKIESVEGTVIKLINGKPTPVKEKLSWPGDEEMLNSQNYRAYGDGDAIYISDTKTEAKTAFSLPCKPDSIAVQNSGGTAFWRRKLAPGEAMEVNYILTWGDDHEKNRTLLSDLSADFDYLFQKNKSIWEEKWEQIFRPGNPILSGCFPVFETEDAIAKKVYYTGPLTMLYLINTNLPEHEKVFLTGGPRWGASITFFWDITLWSTLWAVVDPDMMKEHVSAWIKIDPSQYYGKDNFGGKGVGNGYSANYWALFQLIRSYITVTGDYEFLDEEIEGMSILDHLDKYAGNWEKISIYGQTGCEKDIYRLADFGDDEWNLLECVPTYKHIVPSFNIGYAWMMRETARFHRRAGNQARADSLDREADLMIGRILELYAGNGVWYSLYPDNQKIEVRHCLDFSFFGKYIPDDIPGEIKEEMLDFLYNELMTDHWMRAQSLKDIAAENSDRCDHGPLGAFDGWPADIMDALTQMGYPEKALDFYHAIEPVTNEGIWSQAHELWGDEKETKNAKVRIAERGWHNRESSSGIAMSQVMLKNFFGFYPEIDGGALKPAGNWQFDGKMHHVFYKGEYYSIEYSGGIPVMKKEMN